MSISLETYGLISLRNQLLDITQTSYITLPLSIKKCPKVITYVIGQRLALCHKLYHHLLIWNVICIVTLPLRGPPLRQETGRTPLSLLVIPVIKSA